MEILDFLKIQAEEIIKELSKNGFIEGGKNGPYDDNETPVRITSHWIIIFSWLYTKTNEKKYYNSIKKLADYIYNLKNDNINYTYCCRNKLGKDHVNGTIGAAWIIEGLVEATKILKDEKYYELAVEMFLSHPFDKKTKCWNRYEITGELLGFDETFNHQLWFAASGSQIINYKNNETIRNQINIF